MTSNFRTWLPVILVTIGQAIVILGGGLDLSTGAIVSVGNVILALTVTSTENWQEHPDDPGCLGFGIVAGLLNGFFTSYLGLQPVIITFASSFVYSGLALLLLPSPAALSPGLHQRLPQYFTHRYPDLLIVIIVFVLIWEFFRGENTEGSSLRLVVTQSGLYHRCPGHRVKISTYVISGLMASLAAISYTLLTGQGYHPVEMI